VLTDVKINHNHRKLALTHCDILLSIGASKARASFW